jgi:hypothetical protein
MVLEFLVHQPEVEAPNQFVIAHTTFATSFERGNLPPTPALQRTQSRHTLRTQSGTSMILLLTGMMSGRQNEQNLLRLPLMSYQLQVCPQLFFFNLPTDLYPTSATSIATPFPFQQATQPTAPFDFSEPLSRSSFFFRNWGMLGFVDDALHITKIRSTVGLSLPSSSSQPRVLVPDSSPLGLPRAAALSLNTQPSMHSYVARARHHYDWCRWSRSASTSIIFGSESEHDEPSHHEDDHEAGSSSTLGLRHALSTHCHE